MFESIMKLVRKVTKKEECPEHILQEVLDVVQSIFD